MPAAYLLVTLDVHDKEKFAAYRQVVGPTIQKYGGQALVVDGKWEKLEGRDQRSMVVVLRFPSYEQAKAWYDSDDYAGPLKMRKESADADVILVEGVG